MKVYTPKRIRIITACGAAVFLLTGVMHMLSPGSSQLGDTMVCIETLIYAGLLLGWGVSVEYRIIREDVRYYTAAAVLLMLLWLVLRICKYRFFLGVDSVARHIWYAYYVPIIMLPLMLFFAALCIGNGEKEPERRFLPLLIPALALIAAVLSNDSHQLVFRFDPDISAWNSSYTYGIIYFAVAAWVAALALAAPAVLIRRYRLSQRRKHIWAPFVWLAVGGVYFVLYLALPGRGVRPLFQLPEMFCFITVAAWESCIQTGLIPSNAGYELFFNASTIGAQIADSDHNVRYISEDAVELTREQMLEAEERPLMISDDLRLNSYPVKGGRMYWTDDLSAVNRMNRELEEVRRQLSEYNVLLRAQTSMKKRRARLAEQNRIYDCIAGAVSPQLEKLQGILDGITTDEHGEDVRKKYARACVLNAYVKRRSNLELIGQQSERMNIFELESSIRESLEYLRLCGCICGFERRIRATEEFEPKALIFAYELFETAAEASMDCDCALLVNLSAAGGKLAMRMTGERCGELAEAGGWRARAQELGAEIGTAEEDDTQFVLLKYEGGSGR